MDKEINPRTNGNIIPNPMAKFTSIFAGICIVLFTAFLTMFVIVTNLYSSATVVGSSMYPSINALSDGNKNDVAYYTRYKDAKINDIIIVDYGDAIEGYSSIDAIKRLIAKSGDTICYYQGTILRNGKPVDDWYMKENYNYLAKNNQSEADNWKDTGYQTSKNNFNQLCKSILLQDPNIFKTAFTKKCAEDSTYRNEHIRFDLTLGTYVLTVPEDSIFFLGDNRGNSTDCSCFGPLEEKYLLAKVDFILHYDNNAIAKVFQQFKHIFA